MGYSVAIRTLGTSPDTLRQELQSLHEQSILPDAIFIYIAEGYKRPDFQIGMEQYIPVAKGMVAQRALEYKEVKSEYLFLLDDDVLFAPDSAETLLRQLRENDADCVAVDSFANHKMSIKSKMMAIVTNLVFPRFNQKWAFKIHSDGSFSYINNPIKETYRSQSAAGPASLWRLRALRGIHLEDELWLDKFGFAYGDDDLEFYKLHINGGRLFVSFASGVKNLDSKSSSASFQKDKKKFFIRSMSNLLRWHRMQYMPRDAKGRVGALVSFGIKEAWLAAIHLGYSIVSLNISPIVNFFAGIKEGISHIKSAEYRQIPLYKNENFILR